MAKMNSSLQNSTNLRILFALLVFALFWQLGSWGVLESSEARYAEIPREMLETGNWLMPQYLQILHFDKPLMTYWITAAGLKIFGINAFGARFFLEIAFLVQIILVFKITLELFQNKKLAYYAAIIYCGIPLVLISVRNLTTDAYLNTFALFAVLGYVLYYKRAKVLWLYFFFTCLGLCIFTKGPFGIILPLLSIYPIQILVKQIQNFEVKEKQLHKIHVCVGILITLLIGGWWFFYLMKTSPEFYNFFVKEQLVNRVANAGTMKRSEPFWYYFLLLPLFILPMLSLFIGGLGRYLKQKQIGVKWLMIMSIILPLLLFSMSSSKLILYILPISPYIAISCAYFLYNTEDHQAKKHYLYALSIYLLIIMSLMVLCTGLLPEFPYHANLVQYFLLFLFIIYLSFIILRVKNYHQKILLLFLILPLFVAPLSTDILKKMQIQINSMAPISNFIKSKNLDTQSIIVWNRAVNGISFELQKNIYSVKHEHYSLQRNTRFQPNFNWKKNLIDVNDTNEQNYLKTLIQSPSVFITRDAIPEKYLWLLKPYNQQQSFGKWTVYYKNQ
jgi:4-amino-4-deoxy-L-arabinose transferase-like glycosyltransferase